MDQIDQSKSVLLYIICHDHESAVKANDLSNRINNSKMFHAEIIMIEQYNKLFESQIFQYFSDINIQKTWFRYNFIGIITYSLETKSKISLDQWMLQIENHINNKNTEFIALYKLQFIKKKIQHTVSFIEAATIMHGPYFLLSYTEILNKLGYHETEYLDPNIPSYFCNWWLTKPIYMIQYVEFFKKCTAIIEFNNYINKYLLEHSYYTGTLSKDTLLKMTGKPYYTIHPFLFERLPCFFFHSLKLSNPIYILNGVYEFYD